MNLKDILDVLPVFIQDRDPVLLEGEPGTAKSALVKQATQSMGYDYAVAHFSTWEPVDINGFPWMQPGADPDFHPYGLMANLYRATKPTVFFIDELGQASISTQNALMPLVHRDTRAINGRVLPDCVSIVAATNNRKDKSGANGINAALRSRFTNIIHVDPKVDDFAPWALANGVDPRIVAFLFMNPNLLIANEATLDLKPSPNLRTWEYAAKTLRRFEKTAKPAVFKSLLDGAIGDAAATQLLGFLRIENRLPDISQIRQKPDEVTIPTDPSINYALAAALGGNTEPDHATNVFKFVKRMKMEFQFVFATILRAKNPKTVETQAYVDWAVSAKI